jgi:hypothetical protein
MTARTAVDVVQEQLEAYNARDLDRFAATYGEDIRIYRLPAPEAAIVGQAQLREAYAKRFASPNLHAEIVNRIVLGNKVIDHERVVGIKDTPIEAVAVYEVADGLIQVVWFFHPGEPAR